MSRQAIVAAAASQIGPFDQQKVDGYWRAVLTADQYHDGIKLSWCGAFALAMLHKAGVGLDKHWHFGSGFLLVPPHPLPRVSTPQAGDIIYLDKPFQHHAVCEFAAGDVIHSIDGNQPDVRRKTRVMASALTFYSVDSLLPPPSPAPTTTRPTIHFGSAGDDVKDWQDILFKAGYPRLTDGQFGPKTLLYTKLYQSAHGLASDGIVGAHTWASAENNVKQ